MEKGWILYILELADGSLYTGITNDIDARLQAHASGKGSKYVRSRLPFKLVYSEPHPDRSAASKREAEVKGFSHVEKRNIIATGNAHRESDSS